MHCLLETHSLDEQLGPRPDAQPVVDAHMFNQTCFHLNPSAQTPSDDSRHAMGQTDPHTDNRDMHDDPTYTPRKYWCLREQAEANATHVKNDIGAQVALHGGCLADPICLISLLDVLCPCIGIAIHCDRLDSQVAAGAQDAAGYLTAIGNQDFVESWRQACG